MTARSLQSRARTTPCHPPGMPRPRTASSPSSSTCSGTASTTPPSCRRSSRRSPTSCPIPSEPHLPAQRVRPGLPDLRARRHHRLCRGRSRARSPASLGDGAAQPVPVGPFPGRARRGRPARRRRLRGRLPPARPRGPPFPAPAGDRGRSPSPARPPREATPPVRPYPTVDVRAQFKVMPRIEALTAVHGDRACTNEDLIRNAAYNWSPMAADEIRDKTGIEQRLYTSGTFEEMALQAAEEALEQRRPRTGGDRGGDRVHLHQHPPDSLGGHVDLRVSWASSRPMLPTTSWLPVQGCPTDFPRRYGSCRRWSAPSSSSAPRSSPTRSATSGPRG